MSSTLSRLLEIRVRRVEQTQMKVSVCRNKCQKASKAVQFSSNVLDTYIRERPVLEASIYSDFQESACRSSDMEDYRHYMSKCAAKQSGLEKQKLDAIEAEKANKQELESVILELRSLEKNVEKIALLEENYLKEKQLADDRKAESELDEISTLGYINRAN